MENETCGGEIRKKKRWSCCGEAKEAGEPFSIVLINAGLGGRDGSAVDGFSLAEEIHAGANPGTSTVMMLASGKQLADSARCRQIGAAAYLAKPIRERELREALQQAVSDVSPGWRDLEGIANGNTAGEIRFGKALRILLADDNIVNQKLTSRLLEKRGHTIILASDGNEAMSLLERERVDLVLMDLQMPGMDGFQVTAAIREQEKATGARLPVFAITAYALKGDKERCLNAGMDGYIAKPIRANELYAVVENLTPLASAAVA